MKNKIFEKKFPDQAEAIRFFESSPWSYVGGKGIFNKYYVYTGLYVTFDSQVRTDKLEARVFSDGLVKLYCIEGYLSLVFAIPMDDIWDSLESYQFFDGITEICSRNLDGYYLEVSHANKCMLTKGSDDSFSMEFNHPFQAYRYAMEKGLTRTNECHHQLTRDFLDKIKWPRFDFECDICRK